ncbi:trypsin-like serine peptidase [Amycolatopsis sp. H20-H5]|uniref:trypsin-like serine peptidase n=1 Tax=Amycolatopsis sp. H20-H5 TaxID=3046309 RepID=UPI002DB5BBC3|nr:serine protease [Amycolatopsis sp. H20-H5]MEC3975724.1 serine protease [Amycolatopsis sp. H20-H5]
MNLRRPAVLLTLCAVLALSAAGSVVAVTSDKDAPPAPEEELARPVIVTKGKPDPTVNPAVGALFLEGAHYCTASVVHSDAGDVLLTAAHCIHDGEGGDYLSGITFAPGYHDGVAPYGFWDVGDEVVAPNWATSSDQDLDVGFATAHQTGTKVSLESITGANKLATGSGFEQQITLTGYPDDAERPAVCETTTSQQDTFQLRVGCVGFPTGTSGGPWVINTDAETRLGTVVGVIGGFEYGGDDPDVSYSSYFDTDVATLYRMTAASG